MFDEKGEKQEFRGMLFCLLKDSAFGKMTFILILLGILYAVKLTTICLVCCDSPAHSRAT